MEFLSDVFVKFWKEAIVAVLLTAILPFIRRYVRRQRAKMINFFKEKKRLEEALREEQEKRKEAEERAEQEHKAREEAERINLELKTEIDSLRSELEHLRSESQQKEAVSNAEIEYELGRKYRGVKDYKHAIEHYLIAAEQGHVKAQYALGYMYYNGIGVMENRSEAVKWYRKAAEQGDSYAQEMLNYLQAAKQGDSYAQTMLNYLHQ